MGRTRISLWVWFLVGLLILIGACVRAGRDIPPPSDDDLALDVPDVPPEENAYTLFAQAMDLLSGSTNATVLRDFVYGRSTDTNRIATLLRENATALAFIYEGNQRARCIAPGVDVRLTGGEPQFAVWVECSHLLLADAQFARLARRTDEAAAACAELIRFGDLTRQGSASLVEYMMANHTLETGMREVRELARDPHTATSNLVALAVTMDSLDAGTNAYVRALRGEYRYVVQAIDGLSVGKCLYYGGVDTGRLPRLHRHLQNVRVPAYLLQPNRTKQYFASTIRLAISDIGQPFSDRHDLERPEVARVRRGGWKMLARPNSVGVVLVGMTIPSYSNLQRRRFQLQCEVDATRIVVAVTRFRKEEGRWPTALDELVPAYLAEVPTDPFDGQPFRYVQNRQIAYSVSRDLVDGGGTGFASPDGTLDETRVWNAPDAVFTLGGAGDGATNQTGRLSGHAEPSPSSGP